jgi:hypothetical protein
MTTMTADATEPRTHDDADRLPADPVKYDTPRNAAARKRGLDAPYIAGGEDPDMAATLRRERRDLRLLIGMAVGVVLLGFVLGIIGTVMSLVTGS